MTKEAIIEQLKSHPNYMMEKSFRLRFPEAYSEICNIKFPDNFVFNQKIYHYLNDDIELSFGVCLECGKRCKYINFFNGYSKYCSTKCSSNSKEVKEKKAKTCIDKFGYSNPLASPKIREIGLKTMSEKYGVEYASQSKEIIDKWKKNNLEKYGVEYPLQNKDIQEKVKKTNIEKFGVEYPSQSKEIIDKWKKNNLEKYGVEYPMQSQIVKDKSRQTCLEKYGFESHNSSPEIKEIKKHSCIEKYGVENPFQIESVKEQIKQTNLERYGVENPFSSPDIIDKIRKTNIERYGRSFPNVSHYEDELNEYILTIYSDEIIRNDRNTIRLEFDLYLPKIKFAIEFNGDFWHMNPLFYEENDINPITNICASDIWKRDLNKQNVAKQNGILLFVVWEHDWKHDKEKTKEHIKDIIYSLIKTLDE